MMKLLLWSLAAVAGVAAATQTAANSALAARAGLAAALFLNTGVVWLGTFLFLLASGGPRTLTALAGAPLHHYVGGLAGFAIIAPITFAFPRLGAAMALAIMVLGQGATALAIDHFGLWGMPAVTVSATRLIGVGFLVAGVVLLRR
jgi:transporter family-2 protein